MLYTSDTRAAHNPDMSEVLLIDDDLRLASMIGEYLRAQGLVFGHAADGAAGLVQLGVLKPGVVILDWMMPGMDGLEVCRRLRAMPAPLCYTPVIMLTAKGDAMDRVLGLELGADDYLPKPFEPRELLARVKALLRRGAMPSNRELAQLAQTSTAQLCFGSLEIDRDARLVRVGGRVVELTSYQFDLLVAIAERAGRVLTREQIMEAVRGRELEAFDRSIDVHMGRIRAAIENNIKEPKRILTVRGVGYVFAKQQD